MRTAEQKRTIAREFQNKHANTGQKTKAWAFYDDNPDEIMPRHGPRGRGRIPAPSRAVSLNIRASSVLSAHLAINASAALFWGRAEKIVGNDITVNPAALPVVLDTSVVVEGLFPSPNNGWASKRLMELVLEAGEVAPGVTWAIIDEYQSVLRKFGDNNLNQLCRLLSRSALIPILPAIEVPQVETDPSDTPFVEALVLTMCGAENQRPPSRLVTRDHHLLDMVKAPDSAELLSGRIITPSHFLRELNR